MMELRVLSGSFIVSAVTRPMMMAEPFVVCMKCFMSRGSLPCQGIVPRIPSSPLNPVAAIACIMERSGMLFDSGNDVLAHDIDAIGGWHPVKEPALFEEVNKRGGLLPILLQALLDDLW